jgi:hypothetical protein
MKVSTHTGFRSIRLFEKNKAYRGKKGFQWRDIHWAISLAGMNGTPQPLHYHRWRSSAMIVDAVAYPHSNKTEGRLLCDMKKIEISLI